MEERKNIRRAFFFVFLAIVIIIVLTIWGVPSLVKLSNLVMGVNKGQVVLNKNDNIPPPPPRFNDFPKFTNQTNIEISGSSEPQSTVKFTFNGKDRDIAVDDQGNFSVKLNLNKDENAFSALAVDQAGNTSQKTSLEKITFDDKAPDLSIDSPSDGSSFFGSNQQKITIKGSTEVDASLTINERVISIDGNGLFSFNTSLSEGENNFNLKATDLAGNTTEKFLKYTFTP